MLAAQHDLLRSRSITRLLVHMVWSAQSRVPLLTPDRDVWLAALLERLARRIDSKLVAVGNASDHVHVLVSYPPRLSVVELAHRLKGGSSRALHLETHAVCSWQTGYWAESVGTRGTEALQNYILAQRIHHSTERREREPWEVSPATVTPNRSEPAKGGFC